MRRRKKSKMCSGPDVEISSLDEKFAVRLLEDILRIYSPSGEEGELSVYLKEKLSALNFKNVLIDDAGNVLGDAGEGKPLTLFIGHIDTVPNFLPVKVLDGRVYGRGAVDAKSSMAAMILAAAMWIKDEGEGAVKVCCLVDEEGKGRGIQKLLEGPIDADYAIFGEPSGIRNITIGYRGHVGVNLTVRTNPAHLSIGVKEFNAIELAIDLWEDVKKVFSKMRYPKKSVFHNFTTSIAKIEGGEWGNVAPQSCRLDLDIRVPPELKCEEVIDPLNHVISKFNEKHGKASTSMEVRFRVEPLLLSKCSPVVRALSRSILKALGKPVNFVKKSGTGDMNVFVSKLGIPAATYGPGNSKLSHTLNEYVEVDEYVKSIIVYRNAINELISIKDEAKN
ncbi:MAG: M20/M25/M40 family metallo-hydrolase [Candidatus Bathyarchaeia archaeon]